MYLWQIINLPKAFDELEVGNDASFSNSSLPLSTEKKERNHKFEMLQMNAAGKTTFDSRRPFRYSTIFYGTNLATLIGIFSSERTNGKDEDSRKIGKNIITVEDKSLLLNF